MKRRDFLIGASGVVLLGCEKKRTALPTGALLGPDDHLGHNLRDGKFTQEPTREIYKPIIIAGAGIAGLSCGWWLQREGVTDFALLELESTPGGNARSGRNKISGFPWGAHYLPLPGPDAIYVRTLLAELGVLQGDIHKLAPVYDEQMLVQAPDERLFIHGGWQEGLIPRTGIGASSQQEIARFETLMREWSQRKGRDGRYLFTIPSAMGSQDPEFFSLDSLNFHTWLEQQGFSSEPLRWYISYSLCDDYGVGQHQISAWAGLHYFCCRRGTASNVDSNTVLTSPQGNGWIVEALAKKLNQQLSPAHVVVRIQTRAESILVDVFDSAKQELVRMRTNQLVWAAPLFILARLWASARDLALPDYAPWLVANLSVDVADEQEFTTWDSVIYQGQGLGYVDATHQQLRYRRPERNLTYYRALNAQDHKAARRLLLEQPYEYWASQIFADLQRAHPRIVEQCKSLDIWRWPHAMAIPAPGFLAKARHNRQSLHPAVHLAHSDLSGFSLFEEAQYWGVEAARRVLQINRSIVF
jgi:phytoene dehydrogenase-like protein